MTFMSRARILAASNGSLKSCTDTNSTRQLASIEPFYCDPMTGHSVVGTIGAPPSFADVDVAPIHHHGTPTNVATISSAKYRHHQHEPIYASLSETLSSCNTLDSLGARLRDDSSLGAARSSGERPKEEDVDDDDEGSATESAGDDFEFHNIRTSRQTLITSSSSGTTSPPHSNGNAPEAIFGLEDLRPRSRVARSATYRILCNGLDVKCAGKHDKEDVSQRQQQQPQQPTTTAAAVAASAAAVAASSESRHGIVTCVTIRVIL